MNLLDLLDTAPADTDWMPDAACAGKPPELFVKRDPRNPVELQSALAVCSSCSVRVQCGQYADDHGETGAIWGGVLR